MSEKVQDLGEAAVEQLIAEHKQPVLVDFWAPWCGPCKMIAPLLEEIAASREGLTVVKVNVDDNQALPARLGVRGIPTLALFVDGEHVASKVGAMSKVQLESFLSEHLR